VVPALSAGLGYRTGMCLGMEYRHSFAAMDTPFPGGTGKNWGPFVPHFHIPVLGRAK